MKKPPQKVAYLSRNSVVSEISLLLPKWQKSWSKMWPIEQLYIELGYFIGISDKEVRKTSLWVIDKETWIKGPSLPKQINVESFCATALNSTTVLFFALKSSGVRNNFGYDILKNTWFPMYGRLDFVYGNEDKDFMSCTCTNSQEKTYQRYLLVFLSLFFLFQLTIILECLN